MRYAYCQVAWHKILKEIVSIRDANIISQCLIRKTLELILVYIFADCLATREVLLDQMATWGVPTTQQMGIRG